LALAVKCDFFGARGFPPSAASPVATSAPGKCPSASSAAIATAPKPQPACRRKLRRSRGSGVRRWQRNMRVTLWLIDEDKFFDVQQHMREIRPDSLVSVSVHG